jgi:peptide/nickel transport system permease protein
VLVAIVLFIGLYLLMTSLNDFIDPRTRLRLMGA